MRRFFICTHIWCSLAPHHPAPNTLCPSTRYRVGNQVNEAFPRKLSPIRCPVELPERMFVAGAAPPMVGKSSDVTCPSCHTSKVYWRQQPRSDQRSFGCANCEHTWSLQHDVSAGNTKKRGVGAGAGAGVKAPFPPHSLSLSSSTVTPEC